MSLVRLYGDNGSCESDGSALQTLFLSFTFQR